MYKVLKVLFLIIAVLVLFSFSGCKKEETYYGVLGKCVGPYWNVVRKGAEDAGSELGVKVGLVFPRIIDATLLANLPNTWSLASTITQLR